MNYTRAPKKIVAHCPYCLWMRIYFADASKRLDHHMRAWVGLHIHILRTHGERKWMKYDRIADRVVSASRGESKLTGGI
jgi:hypothetical protein